MIRLIHCGEWKFKEFHDPYEVPEYAILSHRWLLEAEEVTYQDFQARLEENQQGYTGAKQSVSSSQHLQRRVGTISKQSGWEKIEKARDIACELNIEWIWIDSCCINKRDTPELMEAVNSMYQWYAESEVCIAYLSDLDRTELGPCTWFSRGWTLQELIAPSQVLFYNKLWVYCGSRNGYRRKDAYNKATDLSKKIAEISGIGDNLLKSNDYRQIKHALSSIPACQKISWAAKRKTSKPEDMAYCLIGIFGIDHMHLKYGEGPEAFLRLQEEITKQNSDPTLFAWVARNFDKCNPKNILKPDEIEQNNSLFGFHQSLHGIYACHPREFMSTSEVKPMQHVMYNDEITATSKGVKFTHPLWGDGPGSLFTMPLYCYSQTPSQPLGIQLRWVGGNIYARTNIMKPTYLNTGQAVPSQDDVFITHKIYYLQDCIGVLHRNSIRIPKMIGSQMERIKVSPGFLWNEEHELFMTNGTRFPVARASYKVLRDENKIVTLVFGLDYTQKPWFCLLEPGSQLAPSHLEMRQAYLDRVWRAASQKRSENISFIVDAVSGQGSRPYVLNVRGQIDHVEDKLSCQPIFHLDLNGFEVSNESWASGTEQSSFANPYLWAKTAQAADHTGQRNFPTSIPINPISTQAEVQPDRGWAKPPNSSVQNPYQDTQPISGPSVGPVEARPGTNAFPPTPQPTGYPPVAAEKPPQVPQPGFSRLPLRYSVAEATNGPAQAEPPVHSVLYTRPVPDMSPIPSSLPYSMAGGGQGMPVGTQSSGYPLNSPVSSASFAGAAAMPPPQPIPQANFVNGTNFTHNFAQPSSGNCSNPHTY